MGWLFCLLLKILSRVTTLLEVTNFARSTSCLVIFSCLDVKYLDNLISLSLLVYAPIMLTYFKSFPSFLLFLLTKKKDAKGTDVSGLWLSSACAGYFFIKGAGTEGAYIADTCIGKACIGSTCIGSISITCACIKDASIKKTCIKRVESTYSKDAYAEVSCAGDARGVSAINSLGIHSQSSQILELRQCSTILKIGVRAG